MNPEITQTIEAGFKRLSENPYPGRVIIMGVDERGKHAVQLYGITGRSRDSRNRRLAYSYGKLRTEVADDNEPPARPDLTIYDAMLESHLGHFIVSNGHQSNAVLKAFEDSKGLERGLEEYQYEPNAPNFTPRITGVCNPSSNKQFTEFAILRKKAGSNVCERDFYAYEPPPPGMGMCVTTYEGNGDPLPSFQGEPFMVPIIGNMDEIMRTYWDALDNGNLVSLAMRTIPLGTLQARVNVLNQYGKFLRSEPTAA